MKNPNIGNTSVTQGFIHNLILNCKYRFEIGGIFPVKNPKFLKFDNFYFKLAFRKIKALI